MENMEMAMVYYKQALSSADSCHIVKYALYAKEELSHIYDKRNQYKEVAEIRREIDSLNQVYEKEKHLVGLLSQREEHQLNAKDMELALEKKQTAYLLAGLILLTLVLTVGFIYGIRYRKEKKLLELEFERIHSELAQYIQQRQVSEEVTVNTEGIQEALLSGRQKEVLDLLYEGLTNKEISEKLFISENTVKYHIKMIYQILNISNRKELVKSK